MSIDHKLRETFLIEFIFKDQAIARVAHALHHTCQDLDLSLSWMQAYRAVAESRITTYLRGPSPDLPLERVANAARSTLIPLANGEIEVSRLTPMRVYPGASSEAVPHCHYVVRTDVTPGCEEELERWYDEEHMPALAAVPGAVLAQRLVSRDALPRYYACYDLVSPNVLLTPAWLAVRGTDWSGRVRPMFRNTRRIVSCRLVEFDKLKENAP